MVIPVGNWSTSGRSILSVEKRGIHPLEFIIKPTDDLLAAIVPYTKFFPIKMTLAPENFTAAQIENIWSNMV